jgi:hypothetical protein
MPGLTFLARHRVCSCCKAPRQWSGGAPPARPPRPLARRRCARWLQRHFRRCLRCCEPAHRNSSPNVDFVSAATPLRCSPPRRGDLERRPASMAGPVCQVVSGEGTFEQDEVEAFVNQGVAAARTNYQVVAIMGPQSSGKSTLLNHLVRLPVRQRAFQQHPPGLQQGCAGRCIRRPCNQRVPPAPSPCLPAPAPTAVWHQVRDDGCRAWPPADHQRRVDGHSTQDR